MSSGSPWVREPVCLRGTRHREASERINQLVRAITLVHQGDDAPGRDRIFYCSPKDAKTLVPQGEEALVRWGFPLSYIPDAKTLVPQGDDSLLLPGGEYAAWFSLMQPPRWGFYADCFGNRIPPQDSCFHRRNIPYALR